MTRDDLILYVRRESAGTISMFSPATLDRAIPLALPLVKPEAGKPAG
jgi:hypothetical protein